MRYLLILLIIFGLSSCGPDLPKDVQPVSTRAWGLPDTVSVMTSGPNTAGGVAWQEVPHTTRRWLEAHNYRKDRITRDSLVTQYVSELQGDSSRVGGRIFFARH